eukprot:2732839-Rhodomonas_salina.3
MATLSPNAICLSYLTTLCGMRVWCYAVWGTEEGYGESRAMRPQPCQALLATGSLHPSSLSPHPSFLSPHPSFLPPHPSFLGSRV